MTSNGHYVSEKDLFKRTIMEEFGPTKPVVCKFALELLEKVPEYFWTEGASSSGKHHPDHDLGEGGLARHSLMTYRWLKSLLDANTTDMSEYVAGMALAALFHDCCKRGVPGNEDVSHTAFEHPVYAAKFVFEESKRFLDENKEFIDTTAEDEESFKKDISLATTCILSHMGKWNKNEHSKTVLPVPRTPCEYMVHLADYCASRKFTRFDCDFFNVLEITGDKDGLSD